MLAWEKRGKASFSGSLRQKLAKTTEITSTRTKLGLILKAAEQKQMKLEAAKHEMSTAIGRRHQKKSHQQVVRAPGATFSPEKLPST